MGSWTPSESSRPTVADGLDLDGLGDLLSGVGLRRLAAHLGFEECVHQRGLPQATLPCNCTTQTHTLVIVPCTYNI